MPELFYEFFQVLFVLIEDMGEFLFYLIIRNRFYMLFVHGNRPPFKGDEFLESLQFPPAEVQFPIEH